VKLDEPELAKLIRENYVAVAVYHGEHMKRRDLDGELYRRLQGDKAFTHKDPNAAVAFDAAGKLSRKFKVISGQPVGDGLWILKVMRIESFGGRSADRTPTYLDIDKVKD